MKRALNSLRECLFAAFADFGYSDPQAPRQLWAIREGLRRIDPDRYWWQEVRARKEHDCMQATRSTVGRPISSTGSGPDGATTGSSVPAAWP